jgi:hypothetical protein
MVVMAMMKVMAMMMAMMMMATSYRRRWKQTKSKHGNEGHDDDQTGFTKRVHSISP